MPICQLPSSDQRTVMGIRGHCQGAQAPPGRRGVNPSHAQASGRVLHQHEPSIAAVIQHPGRANRHTRVESVEIAPNASHLLPDHLTRPYSVVTEAPPSQGRPHFKGYRYGKQFLDVSSSAIPVCSSEPCGVMRCAAHHAILLDAKRMPFGLDCVWQPYLLLHAACPQSGWLGTSPLHGVSRFCAHCSSRSWASTACSGRGTVAL
jgi:hypothetical protein